MAFTPIRNTNLSGPSDNSSNTLPNETTPKGAAANLHLRAADILERVADAFVAVDRDWRILYANHEACRINQKPLEDFVGKYHWEEWPAGIGTELEYYFRRAMNERVEGHFEYRYVSEPYDVWLDHDVYPSEDGINIFYRDITERKNAELALRRSQEDLGLAVDAAQIGTFYCDYPLDKIVWNQTCKKHFFLPVDAEVDISLFYSLLHPDDREPTRRAIERALVEHVSYNVEYRTLASDGRTRWVNAVGRFYYDAQGDPLRFDGITLDISARKAAEEEMRQRLQRERFLAGLAERARALSDPDKIIADAVHSVGKFLGVSRCIFADIDIEADTCTVHTSEYRADPLSSSIVGVVSIASFGAFVVAEYAARRAVVVDDVRLDTVRVPEGSLAAYEAINIRAHVTVPVVHYDRVVSCMSLHCATPRRWTPDEVELLRTVVERTWLTVEMTRQERALIRETEVSREAHERTARILENTTDGFFALDRKFRFTYINALAERLLSRTRESLLGKNIWEEFPEAVGGTLYQVYSRAMEDGASVSMEDYYAPLSSWMEVRVFPSADGLSVFFQNVNERKAMEAERERLAERERNIAAQLQTALTPAVPKHIPGIALAKYYEAALAEAGVGGDFYDVFPMDKGCSAIVLGDLSGKGLAAATQVATVRNMLRYALYRARTLAGALEGLNGLLVEQGLLTGFCTLFVGAYDRKVGTLTYVNAGQEPALIARAAGGLIEQLAPTGPVLGGFDGACFEERTVLLLPGDALAIFSDGLTEVGASRKEMLGVDGVSNLLAEAIVLAEVDSAESVAEHLALRLIAGVDAAAAGGVTRDDVCLLVAVIE